MDTQSIINALEALRDKMTPEQIAKLEQVKKEYKMAKAKETQENRTIVIK